MEEIKAKIEAILFACGREVSLKEFMTALEINEEEIIKIIEHMKQEYQEQKRGIDIIKIKDAYQMCTKQEYYDLIYPILDKRSKPNLSNAALETLAIIAYNEGMTRAEIESIRGVNSDATIYKLLEYELIEEAGKLDAPGRPMTYRTTAQFLKMFGYSSLEELPPLPKYKMDENRQIVIDDLIQENEQEVEKEIPERGQKDETTKNQEEEGK